MFDFYKNGNSRHCRRLSERDPRVSKAAIILDEQIRGIGIVCVLAPAAFGLSRTNFLENKQLVG
jgi:hypothetical protein